MAIAPTYVTAFTLTSALGVGNAATLDSIRNKASGLREHSMGDLGRTWFGFVDSQALRPINGELAAYDNDCTRIVQTALEQDGFTEAVERAKSRYGKNRIGCFLGTITSGIHVIEELYRDHEVALDRPPPLNLKCAYSVSLDAIMQYVRRKLDFTGPYATIGTACSSSAKVFATAHRYLQMGFCDAAIVAGVEGYSETLINGFRSLGVLSTEPCRPWDSARDGISIGAAAGFALLEREPLQDDALALVGYGETADGHDMTAPHPEGKGIETAMLHALERAGLDAKDIDYINAHGSATPMNDMAEDAAVHRIFGDRVPVSSTKGLTGHTQGAAGITEAIILMLGMQNDLVPGIHNTREIADGLKCNVSLDNQTRRIRYGLTNSMGFGGNNAVLIFGRLN
ncbi:MAG: beta-ketoacyl synthase N-terminal-like domain-containing protein [Nevskia sp.]|nr:beta-ketoacyl synthase N-terminal-like domain-containing protein [Nevskia sp.]